MLEANRYRMGQYVAYSVSLKPRYGISYAFPPYACQAGLEVLTGDRTKGRSITYVRIDSLIESVDSISRDERGFPLTQYITNGRISRAG